MSNLNIKIGIKYFNYTSEVTYTQKVTNTDASTHTVTHGSTIKDSVTLRPKRGETKEIQSKSTKT